jgi:hypothetical protein
MLGKRMLVVLAVLALLLPLTASAEEAEGGFDFGLTLGIGADTFYIPALGENVTYQKLTVSPDIAFGKFGIGLELTLHYTFTDQADVDSIRAEGDWIPDPALDQNYLDVYLPKFKYIRYGFKGDPLYAKLGSIEDGTLGNGFIMNDYDNTLFLPEQRIFGLAFDLDGALFGFPYLGLETFVGNVARFDVIGARLYARPLAGTEVPLLKNLQLGATFATDTDPGLHLAGHPDLEPVYLYGADLRQPILARQAISLAAFTDVAVLGNRNALGGMVGFGGRIAGIILYGAQIRILGKNFVPVYFDSTYDLFRADIDPDPAVLSKHDIASGAVDLPAYTGWLASLGFSLFADLLVFNLSLDGPFSSGWDPDNYLDWPHLYAEFLVGKGLVRNLSLEVSYDKRKLAAEDGFFRDLFSFDEAVIRGRLNYSIGAAVLSLVYDLRYDPVRNKWITHSGIESAIELF